MQTTDKLVEVWVKCPKHTSKGVYITKTLITQIDMYRRANPGLTAYVISQKADGTLVMEEV